MPSSYTKRRVLYFKRLEILASSKVPSAVGVAEDSELIGYEKVSLEISQDVSPIEKTGNTFPRNVGIRFPTDAG